MLYLVAHLFFNGQSKNSNFISVTSYTQFKKNRGALGTRMNIDKLVEASPFFSLLIDESTDVSNHENLVVYVKLLKEFKPELHFLENVNVRDGKAETITTAVNLLMERRNLHKDKMTEFGSDGASVHDRKKQWSFKI